MCNRFIYLNKLIGMTTVSIVTPCLNAEPFIERTIESVLSQKGDFTLEYIVVDGVSVDGTLDIIKRYDGKLSWVSERDPGQTAAINKGLRMTSGEIVAFLNADDVYKPGAIQRVVEAFDGSTAQWAFGKCDIIDIDGNEIRKSITSYKNYHLRNATRNRLLAENFISQPAVFWRRSIMEQCGVFDEAEHYVMDYEYWLRLWNQFEPIYIDSVLSSFRWYETSKSGSGFGKQFADELRVAKKYAGNNHLAILLHHINYYKIVSSYTVMAWMRKAFPR